MKTILVVEDFAAVQQFLREMLESKGYATLGATNGNKAYEILVNQGQRISLILTDYHMPDESGYDLLKKIKGNQDTQNIPVIFVTAEGNPELINEAKKLGFTAWIKKPYRSEALLQEIERAISSSVANN